MSRSMVIVIIVLAALVALIFGLREWTKYRAAKAVTDAQAQQAALLQQAMALQAQREQIEFEQTTTLGDWLDFGGNFFSAIGSAVPGINIGGGGSD